ncbi:hypothetical protein L9F63_010428 [Diploptera punctata]|uniref:Uncharacterized protein n=1 Tax=Diploptera punctata TaxID=6984 RepID=A0AAD8AHB2_DIPPU|nr:hypothetical protein L9F63_010428 [Diploptera punctata]
MFKQHISITVEDESIKTLSIAKRKCIFLYENNLKIFGWYSYGGCLMECRYNLAIKLCGCSPHVYPQSGECTFLS